ncbi:MAG: phosphatase PAP2 family protein [Actinomycetes bacterium]|jgi:undecaprenyl-diphosphatase|nr:phosphatase PAP2 family protein [Actinomycetes bacterium]
MNRYVVILGAAAIFVMSLFGFYELASDVNTSVAVARFDESMTRRVQSWRRPALDALMKVITWSAGIFGMTVLGFGLFFYLRHMGRSPEATATAVLVLGGVALSDVLKRILQRVRPEEALALIKTPVSSSFPSGHSMTSFCWSVAAIQAILLAPFAPPVAKALVAVLCVLYALAVGVSRVYLGVHYPSDVVAAWLLGIAWMSVVTGVYYWQRTSNAAR